MARLNISLSNEMARKIADESNKLGKTISSLITEATNSYIGLREQNIEPDELQEFLMFFRIITSARSVPVPFKLLDDVLAVAMGESEEKPPEMFYETGLIIGSLIRKYASDMETLSRLCERLKFRLPLDDIRFTKNLDHWEVFISGAGYGKSSSECLSEGLRGFVEAYEMKIKSLNVMAGFVKATFL